MQSFDECIDSVLAIVIVTEQSDILDKLQTTNIRNRVFEVIVDGRNCLAAAEMRKQHALYPGIGRRL